MAKKDIEEAEVVEVVEDEDEDEDYEDEYEKEGWSFRKKFFVILIVIVLIIAAAVGMVLLNPNVESVIIEPPNQLEDGSGISIKSHALLKGSGSANGDGKLRILYGGEEQYSTKIKFKSDLGYKEVKFEDFVYDTGQYEIVVTFGDKSANYFFDLEDNFDFGIAENVEVALSLEPNGPADTIYIEAIASIINPSSYTGGKYLLASPRYYDLEITIAHESTYSEILKTPEPLYKAMSYVFSDFVYYTNSTGGPGSGNYSVSAKITNHYVKQTSPKYSIDLENVGENYLNIFPSANAGGNITTNGEGNPLSLDGTVEVSFDASDSWNDGKITKYLWDFNFEQDQDNVDIFTIDHESTSPTTTWVFDQTQRLQDTYRVGLKVVGDVLIGTDGYYDPFYEFDYTEIYVFITWI